MELTHKQTTAEEVCLHYWEYSCQYHWSSYEHANKQKKPSTVLNLL